MRGKRTGCKAVGDARSVVPLQLSPRALSVMLFPLCSVGTEFPPNKPIRIQEKMNRVTGRKIPISFI